MKELFQAWFFFLDSSGWQTWYVYVVVSLLVYGLYQYGLDRLVTDRRESHSRPAAANAAIAGVTFMVSLLSGAYVVHRAWTEQVIALYGPSVLDTAFLGLLQGVLFLLLNISRFRARRYLPQHVVLPITKLSILIVIVLSWVLFDEFGAVTGSSLTGFVLIAVSIYLLGQTAQGGDTEEFSRLLTSPGALPLALATLFSAGISLLAKYAVGPFEMDIALFIFFSNAFTCLFAFLLLQREWRRLSRDSGRSRRELARGLQGAFRRGLGLGVLNLLAYSTLLAALAVGSASVVVPIHSLYLVIPILLAALFEGENLTDRSTVGLILSILAIIVLR